MKLRNKKTGDAVYVDFQIPLSNNNDALGYYSVTSLKKLNESFEDYMPTEPLIKDEKIRKAVRAWVDVNDIRYIHMKKKENTCMVGHDALGRTYKMEIIPEYHERIRFKDYKDSYTIVELCGDEEE